MTDVDASGARKVTRTIGLDHIPECLFPLLASRLLLPLTIFDIVAGVTIFVVGALIVSPILFRLNLRDEPH